MSELMAELEEIKLSCKDVTIHTIDKRENTGRIVKYDQKFVVLRDDTTGQKSLVMTQAISTIENIR